ncbi:hypothetical protein [Saccharothrix hoggarensis]|uniref:Uncharacterized protein n=1 Tax=Saccharothrix hoggarensis TaxID=913853 RepID=A0ABW3QYT3_9PSEU
MPKTARYSPVRTAHRTSGRPKRWNDSTSASTTFARNITGIASANVACTNRFNGSSDVV